MLGADLSIRSRHSNNSRLGSDKEVSTDQTHPNETDTSQNRPPEANTSQKRPLDSHIDSPTQPSKRRKKGPMQTVQTSTPNPESPVETPSSQTKEVQTSKRDILTKNILNSLRWRNPTANAPSPRTTENNEPVIPSSSELSSDDEPGYEFKDSDPESEAESDDLDDNLETQERTVLAIPDHYKLPPTALPS